MTSEVLDALVLNMTAAIFLIGVAIALVLGRSMAAAVRTQSERRRDELGRDLVRLHQRKLVHERAAAAPLPRWRGLPEGASADIDHTVSLLRVAATTAPARPTDGPVPGTHHREDHLVPQPTAERPTRDAAVTDARIVVIGAAAVSLVTSVLLWFSGYHDEGVFVGLWVPSILALGSFVLDD